MADLNALIAQGAQFQAPPDPFVQYGRMQQLEQGQQANQLNRMKMEEAQAASVERNALRGLDPTSPDYESQLFRVNPQLGIAYRKERTTAEAQQATQKAQQAQALKTNLDNYRSFLVGVNDQPSYDAWRTLTTKNIPELANMLPTAFSENAKNTLLQTADDISKRLNAPPPAPEKTPAPPAMVAEYTFAKTPDGGGFQGTYQQFVTARAAAGRAPAAPRPEQPPVAVVDPVTGKPVYVTREQALSGKMTPASAMEGLPPKEIQARESKFPAATSAVKTFESSAEKLATDLERLATHPGLSGISGLVYGRTPAITKDARAAQALYDSIIARGGFQELQNMRASSPTGGALGNVSNQEGQYLRDAFAPINRTQDTTDLSRSLKDAAVAARTSKQRVRDAYDMTYEYKTSGSATPKPSAVAPNVDALLEKYK
jgi:hypothetical protein